jgi:hypothetical protein
MLPTLERKNFIRKVIFIGKKAHLCVSLIKKKEKVEIA